MLIPPKYTLTPTISKLLSQLEASKEIISEFEIPNEIEINIRRQSTLKSSLFSARIEGNDLLLHELPQKNSADKRKVEIFNILKAFNQIYSGSSRKLSATDILKMHDIVLQGLDPDAGHFRRETSAIFNSAGVAIYLTPPPSQIRTHLKKLLNFINSSQEIFVPIKAILCHLTFEKIHPFIDGNGRVGRLLLQAVLFKEGYGMKGLLSLEEYLEKNRSEYYRGLEENDNNMTGFVEFMLQMLVLAAEDAKKLVLLNHNTRRENFLLPRREEILNIIKDHMLISFDTIRRRFFSINERTLRYDLKKLQDGGYIKKRGATKGVFYEAN